LTRMSSQARRRQRSRRIRQWVGSTVGLTIMTSALWLWLRPLGQLDGIEAGRQVQSSPTSLSGRLTCPLVLEHCDHYLLGKISDQDRQQIRTHLGYCAHCEVAYRRRAEQLQVEFTVLVLPATPTSYALYAVR
jgi:predicted anti-sigma-YlaC factor YlaD